ANIDVIGDMPTTCLSEFLITVSSTNFQDINKAGFGSTSIDIHAPGEGIYSTKPGGIYGTLNGTSMASPHVAGAISYLYSKASDSLTLDYYSDMAKTSRYFKSVIMEGIDSISSLVNKSVTGGRLNLYKSLEKIKQWKQRSPVSTITNPIEIKIAQDASNLRFYYGSEALHVQIFNTVGKKFYDEEHIGNCVIPTDKFPHQMYFIRLHDKNGNIFTHKFYPH
ncbi:MAG: S8 family serine peptidase, partial [Chitinophagales bacterium]|nr:S8 family serine peptidase [Chitinophagales bacterium]